MSRPHLGFWAGSGLLALIFCTGCINKTGDTNIGVSGRCGDGSLDRNEDCDDGDDKDGDGCSADCEVEPGWSCARPGRSCSELEAENSDDENADEASDDERADDSSESTDDDSSNEETSSEETADEPSSSDDPSSNADDDEPPSAGDDDVTETSDDTTAPDETTSEDTDATDEPVEPEVCSASPSAGAVEGTWTRQFGTLNPDHVSAVAIDADGNVIVVGDAQGQLPDQDFTYDTGPTAFVRKYDPSGSLLWSEQFATGTWTDALAVGVDTEGNVFVGGSTKGALGEVANAGLVDAYVRKYDAAGEERWLTQFGTDDWDVVNALALTSDGSVVAVGYTQGVFPNKVGDGISKDAFATKLDPDGNPVWTEQFGADEDRANAVAVDVAGNVFIAGMTDGALPTQNNFGDYDLFVRALAANGDERWTQQLGSVEADSATDIDVDTSGNVYVAGYTYDKLTEAVSEGEYDAALIKFTDAGELVWLKQFGSGGSDLAYALAIDDAGNVIVAGETDMGFPGQTALGLRDVFVRGYDSAGKDLWTGQFGGDGIDVAMALALDADGKLVLGGFTTSSLAEAPAGETDPFVMVLDP